MVWQDSDQPQRANLLMMALNILLMTLQLPGWGCGNENTHEIKVQCQTDLHSCMALLASTKLRTACWRTHNGNNLPIRQSLREMKQAAYDDDHDHMSHVITTTLPCHTGWLGLVSNFDLRYYLSSIFTGQMLSLMPKQHKSIESKNWQLLIKQNIVQYCNNKIL